MSTNLEIGIVGLPKAGKTTIFNALTGAGAVMTNFIAAASEPNLAVVSVPDERLAWLDNLYKSKRVVHTAIKFVDIAGLSKGAGNSGLGNKFLAAIREADAVIQVVRGFHDDNVMIADGAGEPAMDMEIFNLELCIADLEVVEKRQERLKKQIKGGDTKSKSESELLASLEGKLSEGVPVRDIALNDDEKNLLQGLNLLTAKPVLLVINVGDDYAANPEGAPEFIAAKVASGELPIVAIAGKLEAEIADLPDAEADEFAAMMSLSERAANRIIKQSYKLLDLITYLTAGEPEVRAWTVRKGAKAPEAAGKIHSDIERGFIRAETVAFADLQACGNMVAAKEKGLVRLEGKEYVVKDGDVIHFRFNV